MISITKFLNRLEMNGSGTLEIKSVELYNKYREWCNNNNEIVAGRNKFYELIKLYSFVEFKHGITGDNFILHSRNAILVELKEKIKMVECMDDLEELKKIIVKEINIRKPSRIKKTIIDSAITEDQISPVSRNRIKKFFNEEILQKNIKQIKMNELYNIYKKWNKKDTNRKEYKKSKFYMIMKSGKSVTSKHLIDGDYFIFKYDKED